MSTMKEGREDCGRLRNEMKRTTEKAMKVYLESVCDETGIAKNRSL